MNTLKSFFFLLMAGVSLPVLAQNSQYPQNQKNTPPHARVEVIDGQTSLVLHTGRRSTGSVYSTNIVLSVDATTWHQLDSIASGPWGGTLRFKDRKGNVVVAAKANVNSREGLMFTSGPKCAVITKEQFFALPRN